MAEFLVEIVGQDVAPVRHADERAHAPQDLAGAVQVAVVYEHRDAQLLLQPLGRVHLDLVQGEQGHGENQVHAALADGFLVKGGLAAAEICRP